LTGQLVVSIIINFAGQRHLFQVYNIMFCSGEAAIGAPETLTRFLLKQHARTAQNSSARLYHESRLKWTRTWGRKRKKPGVCRALCLR